MQQNRAIETEKQYKKGTLLELDGKTYKVILSSDILNGNDSEYFLTELEEITLQQ